MRAADVLKKRMGWIFGLAACFALMGETAALACQHYDDGVEPVTVGYIAQTETDDGYTGDKRCPECNELIASGTVIPRNEKQRAAAATFSPSTGDDSDNPNPSPSPSDSGVDNPDPSPSPSDSGTDNPDPSPSPSDSGMDNPNPSPSPSDSGTDNPNPSPSPSDSGTDNPDPSPSPSDSGSDSAPTPSPSDAGEPVITPLPSDSVTEGLDTVTPIPTIPSADASSVSPELWNGFTEDDLLAAFDALDDGFAYTPGSSASSGSSSKSSGKSSTSSSSTVTTSSPSMESNVQDVLTAAESTAAPELSSVAYDAEGRPYTRDLTAWPIFSSKFPWRRLRMTPSATEIISHPAGTLIWSPDSAVSPLQLIMDGVSGSN